MPSYILKIEDRYFTYSTIPDAPTSEPMTLEAFKAEWQRLHGVIGMLELQERLTRVETKGTSSYGDASWRETVSCNRTGPGESELTPDQFVEWVRTFGADERGSE